MRVRHADHRQPERRRLGERRRAGTAHHQVRRRERGRHLPGEERERAVPVAALRRQRIADGQHLRLAGLAGHVEHPAALDEPPKRPGNRGVEAPHGLRPAEDEEQARRRRDSQPLAGCLAVDRARVPNRGPGHVAALHAERGASRLEADRDHVRQPGGRPDAAAGHHVPLPEDRGDAQEACCGKDRDRDVAAARDDGVRAVAGQPPERLRERRREPEWIEHEVDIASGAPERAQGEPRERDPDPRDDPGLQAAMAADPGQLRRGRQGAERAGDGHGRVDVPARPACRDHHSHPPILHVPRSRGRSPAGCRRRRGSR